MKDLFDYYDEFVAGNMPPVQPTEPQPSETPPVPPTDPQPSETPTDIVNSILARLDDLERMVTNARDNQPTCE